MKFGHKRVLKPRKQDFEGMRDFMGCPAYHKLFCPRHTRKVRYLLQLFYFPGHYKIRKNMNLPTARVTGTRRIFKLWRFGMKIVLLNFVGKDF